MYKLKKVRLKQVNDGALYSHDPVNTPEKAVEMMRDYLNDFDREAVMVLTLDSAMHPLNVSTVSVGALNGSLVVGREVFKTAILVNAAGIILMHNHPSGDLNPSREDREVTENMKKAGELLGIGLLDHIITSKRGMYSFKNQGQLDKNTVAVIAAEEER